MTSESSPSLAVEAYGLAIATAFDFAALQPIETHEPDLTFEVVAGPISSRPRHQVYASDSVDEHGVPSVHMETDGEVDVLAFGQAAAFEVGQSHITCFLADEEYRPAVEVWLLGTVLSLWMERAGLLALHAGSVIVGDCAIGFVGTNGSGKSTLVADLVTSGLSLLTDDILPLERRGEAWHGRPGYPQMRMWPAQAERLLGGSETLKPVLPWGEKLRVPVGGTGFGSFHAHPTPLAALYVPVRDESDEEEIRIEPVPPHEALATLVEHSFVAPLMNVVPFRAERFARLADAATRIPMRRLRYPSGYGHLPRVHTALLADIEAL